MTNWLPRPAAWTLRRRLLLAVLSLLALVVTAIAVLSVVTVRGVLMERVDTQLVAAAQRAGDAADRPPGGGEGPPPDGGLAGGVPDFLEIPGQPEDTLGARIVAGEVDRAAVLDQAGTGQPIDAATAAPLLTVPVDGTPVTVDLGPELRDYRVVAVETASGEVIVTGLSLSGVHDTVDRLVLTIAAVAVLGLLLAGVAGTVVVRGALRPLDRVAATAARVTELPLSTGEVTLPHRVPDQDTDPRTEVGQVGAALNRLLDHVAAALQARAANERQVRQFVADASHELRTPLAAIRGYAELTRRVPDPVPPDVQHALARVESEAVRMSGLVDDLLLLARLDSAAAGGDGPGLAGTEEVDLSSLLLDAVGDARAAGPDHRWELDLPPEPVVVTGDRDRLHQVLANLLSNARVHTPSGSTVTAALRPVREDGARLVRLSVTDDGPGIPADLLPHIFERFRRADTSRSRASGSSGLGLAIVDAVVQAHGGQVTATSVPGRTQLIVQLPSAT